KADIEYVIHKTAGKAVECYPLGAVTRNRDGKELTEIYDMRSAGAVAFTDADLPVADAGIMLRTLQYVKQFDGTIINVPSDHRIVGNATINEGVMSTRLGMYGIPDVLEEVMVERDILLAEYAASKVHITGISTARALDRIRLAKQKGIQVTCSVTPYHLYFDEEMLGDYDTNFKVNPPLRTARDVAALKEGVTDGTIDAVASFHIPWDTDAKACEFEYAGFGMATLETCFGAVCSALTGYVPVDKVIQLFTSGPRNILGLPPVSIAEGQTANLTLFNETDAWTRSDFVSKGVNQAFAGQPLTGRPLATFFANQFVTLINN
ncbi:MAG TPA: dihydroorotase, partial [Bacteroidetes bacterium]|nr:dihydroorotase [Bacteroidota bacterium]